MLGLGDFIGSVAEGAGFSSPLGIGLVAVTAVAVVGRKHTKPLAKSAIKGYLSLTQRTQEWAAEAVEQWHDLYAEATSEYAHGVDDAPPAPAAPGAATSPEAAADQLAHAAAARPRQASTKSAATLETTG